MCGLRIATATGHGMTITPDHYLFANGRLATAKSVRVGDKLELIVGKLSPVVAIDVQHAERGLIAPHALHSSDLYVNDIRASSYTRTVQIAHMLLAPIRGVVRSGISKEPLGKLLRAGWRNSYRPDLTECSFYNLRVCDSGIVT